MLFKLGGNNKQEIPHKHFGWSPTEENFKKQ